MKEYIVIADDDPDICRLIAKVLKSYTIWQASNGVDALELIRRVHPELVILDVGMPTMTGVEVANAMAADPATASIPILFLSAHGEPGDIQVGLRAGGIFYLVKPFDPEDLASDVRAILIAASRPSALPGRSHAPQSTEKPGTEPQREHAMAAGRAASNDPHWPSDTQGVPFS
jgi:DNA-binding response OmpR family regulator